MCTLLWLPVTYERPSKALFKEDAGRAHDVVQHVAVLHQRTEGLLERFILYIQILISLQLLAHCPHLTMETPVYHPLWKQIRVLNHQTYCASHQMCDWSSKSISFQRQSKTPAFLQSNVGKAISQNYRIDTAAHYCRRPSSASVLTVRNQFDLKIIYKSQSCCCSFKLLTLADVSLLILQCKDWQLNYTSVSNTATIVGSSEHYK